eukprot:7542987-Alexandrium_andersonii.AAC.1
MGWMMPLPKPPEEASRRALRAHRTAGSPVHCRLRVCQRRQSGRVHASVSVQRLRRKKARSSVSSESETWGREQAPSGAWQSPTSWSTQTSLCRLRNSATEKAHAS